MTPPLALRWAVALLGLPRIVAGIVAKGLDRPKQIIAVIHNESTTAVHWYRHPEKRDAKSGMVAQHDHMVLLYRTEPTRVTPPANGVGRDET